MKEFCIGYRRLFLIILFILGLLTVIPLCFGYHGYAIETGSMEPTIPVGSVIYVKESTVKLNDVITFRLNGKTITHRIVGVDDINRILITKGDANKYNDDYKVAIDDVVGKVEYSIPWVGWCIMYLQSLEGKITGGILLVLFVICSFYKKEKKNEL